MATPISDLLLITNSNSYSDNKFDTNSNSNSYSDRLSVEQEDNLVTWAKDLIHPDYRVWFIKRLRSVGQARFTAAAVSARKYEDATTRQKVFAYLLKEAT